MTRSPLLGVACRRRGWQHWSRHWMRWVVTSWFEPYTASRYSLPIVAAVLLAAVVIRRYVVGAVAGFLGGVTDNILMRVSDVTLAFPPVLLAMAIAASLGPGLGQHRPWL